MEATDYRDLEAAIDCAREKMIRHAKRNGYLDEGTLKLSQQLDQLLNELLRKERLQTKRDKDVTDMPYYPKKITNRPVNIIA